MSRRNTCCLPVEKLTLAELYREREELKRFLQIGREMTAQSGPNKYRERSLHDAMLRLVRVDTFIDTALGVDAPASLDA